MQNELERFVARPTGRNYLRVRSLILRAANERRECRDPLESQELTALETLFAQRQFAALRESMESMLPAWSLSPRFYWLGSAAALELQDQEGAEVDRYLYQICLRGLLATGSGSYEAPYWITYASDAEELLHRLGLQREKGALVRSPHGLCQVLSCQNGRELWCTLAAHSDQAELLESFQSMGARPR
jgi:hypothetical protein